MPPPIVPGADDGRARDRRASACLSGRRESWRPRARRKTGAAAPSTRSRRRNRRTARARAREPASKSIVDARFDGVDGRKRRARSARRLAERGARGLARRPGRRRDRRSCPAARASCGVSPRGGARLREGDRAVAEVAVDDARRRCRRLCARAAAPACRRCTSRAPAPAPHKPRQSLRAAGAGNDAEQHFRLADLRIGDGDAVMARHRELEAAAERVAMNGGDERLGDVLEPSQQRMHRLRSFERLLARLQRARRP